jgi:hypothetical protein
VQEAHEEEEWEPGGDLRNGLGRMPLLPGPDLDGHLAELRPLLREALGELGRLQERRGGLSRDERVRREAIEGLLAASAGVGPGG